MKNIYGKTVYPKYEIALKQHVKGSVEDDYESVEFDGADNYREAVKMAKKYSLDIGSGNIRYKESESLFNLESYNVPNNVFPIFWWPQLKDNNYHKTLFRRL